jgi:hypothetical protein
VILRSIAKKGMVLTRKVNTANLVITHKWCET